jgi:hypothetical protein
MESVAMICEAESLTRPYRKKARVVTHDRSVFGTMGARGRTPQPRVA